VFNELPTGSREALFDRLLDAAGRGAPMLIVEPIARGVAPWWNEARMRIEKAGGRADEWTIVPELPPVVAKFSRAAGLNHREVKARSLFIARSK
jgi:hypothetical protein